MKTYYTSAGFLLVACSLVLAGCDSNQDSPSQGGAGSAANNGKLSVITTFYPTQYFAQRIGADFVAVNCPVPDDEDAIFWMPDDQAIQQYQGADLILLNGASFEKWADKVNLPQSRIVKTALPLQAEFISYESAVEHSHGKTGEHSHEGIDGHTWVDPVNAKIQAGEIRNALILRLPNEGEAIEANFQALAADLDALDASFKALAAKVNPPVLCSHPAYNYIARRYQWKIHNLDLDPGEMPSDEVFAEIAATLEQHPAQWILWESDPLPEIAERFKADLDLRSVTFSPCELLSAEDQAAGIDYLSIMKANFARLRDALTR